MSSAAPQPEAGVSHQQQQLYAAAPPPAALGQPTAYSQQPQQQQLYNGQPKEWSTGLCSCGGDCGEFCVSCWCPCIGYSKYKTRLESLQLNGTAIPPGEAPACGPPGVLYLAVHCLTGFGFIFDLMARTEIRTRYNIRGNALGDCCTAYCCIPCTQGQHSREIRLEEESVRARTHGGPLAAPGQAAPMQPQQPMQYPPPSKAA
ncbi:hypothetical protein C6P46_004693 [Rhodotorula mucilaginosa]|uniref:PLAC8-domain-containing protein n=1 Tax=Rhodotorula mucilaginosa TaxID=5537 RepID=A0A9P6W075_RHOMI|nr:hypothetical protein C6P46_004693 [Rhodotorula mucilaginosa]